MPISPCKVSITISDKIPNEESTSPTCKNFCISGKRVNILFVCCSTKFTSLDRNAIFVNKIRKKLWSL